MTSEYFTHKHNFPALVSSFIGREQELQEIEPRLGRSRLITLTGAGGIGKTRLALQAAMAQHDHFSDGIWLVDLAPLTTSELVLETIAKALNLSDTGVSGKPALISSIRFNPDFKCAAAAAACEVWQK